MEKKEIQHKWAEIVAKAWSDPQFKKELLANPQKALKKLGIDAPQKLKIIENTNDSFYVALPQKPEGSISDKELKNITAAGADATAVPCNNY